MSNCAKCGRYFETSKQTDYCSECERSKIFTGDMPLPGFGKQEGWICPVCGRGLSPWTSFCPCQSDFKITYGTSTGSDVDLSEYQDMMDRMQKALEDGEIKL
jgi:hypothetical protein